MADKCEHRKKATLTAKDYEVYVCEGGHVHVDVKTPELSGNLTFANSTETYDFADAIMRGYDMLEGIPPATRKI